MPTLAIDKGFLSDLVKLEKPVAKRVTEVFDEFDNATYTGLQVSPLWARIKDLLTQTDQSPDIL